MKLKIHLHSFVSRYITNIIISNIPSWRLRRLWLKFLHLTIGQNSNIDMSCYFMSPNKVNIGQNSHINQSCFIDARGGITIGNSVSISHYVKLCTGSHSVQSLIFEGDFKPIVIEDYVWIGIGAIILNGVTIGEGAVVAAGAIVTKDVAPYTIVAGMAARKIGERPNDLNYKCLENENYLRFF